MARGDGTGPNGMGPMSGRGMGFCAGYVQPGFADGGFVGARGPGRGRGRGMGMGMGMGWRNGWAGRGAAAAVPQPMTAEAHMAMLRNQAAYLAEQLDAVKGRIEQLSPAKGQE